MSPPPERIGDYRVLGHLGEGHFGAVYLAEGPVPLKSGGRESRRVAVKQLREPWSMGAFETLVNEFELLEQVKHRSLCKVYEFLDRECAVVMELVEGVTLRELLERCEDAGVTVWPEAALEIGCELADCLYQAHATPSAHGGPLRLVHRDLKPENVMLTASGEVKVLDFGLARIDDGVRDAGGQGTPLYMAPEQVRSGPVDHRTDLFACGLVLYELLTGQPAYPVSDEVQESGLEQLMARIERAELDTELRTLRRQLPKLGAVVARCLQATPDDRPEHGHELLLDLRSCRGPDARGALTEFAGYVFSELGLSAAPTPTPVPSAPAAGRPGMMTGTPSGADHPERQSMAKNPTPPRPGPPPRPGASSGPGGSRPRLTRPAARPPGRAPAGGKMWTPGEKGAPAPDRSAPRPEPAADTSSDQDLRMVPLSSEGSDPEFGQGPHHQDTQFFALPTPRGPEPDEDEAVAPLRKVDPIAAASAPAPGPPAAAPPGHAGYGGVPQGATPPMGPTPMQPMHMPMGIQGPVASGPVAGYPGMGGAQMPPDPSADLQRAQSYRVFAVVLGLMFMVSSVLVVVAILTVYGVYVMNQAEDPKPVDVVVTPPPAPRTPVDTGLPEPPAPNPQPKPRSNPRPQPVAPVAPVPEAPSTDPGPVTIALGPGSPAFTSVEVVCTSENFRERGMFSGGSATVPGVPRVDCTAYFKGGPPAKAKVTGGDTRSCTFVGAQANCK